MADVKISSLTEATTASAGDFFIINEGDTETKKINVGSLRGSLGAARSFLINFPDDPGFKFEAPDNNFYIAGTTNQITGSRGQFVQTTELNDIFAGVTPITITMPAGTDSAVVTLTYTVSMKPCPASDEYSSVGFANFGYTLNCQTNKTTPRWSPGGGTKNVFGVGARMYGPVFPWSAYNSIDASVRDQRAASQTQTVARSMRIYFDESTDNSPTTLTFSIDANVFRLRGCTAGMSTGKIAIHPYRDDALDDFGRSLVNSVGVGLTEDDDLDDGGMDDDSTAILVGREIREEMNYISNAIHETLDYDSNLDPNAPAILDQALKDIFLLKQRTGQTIKDYTDEIKRIRTNVAPYVAFRFDFEPTTLTKYF